MDSLRGQLLIAGPLLEDPNFRRSVVLIAEHGEGGAMGLILNRPSETAVEEAAPELGEVADPQGIIFEGGPVQPTAVVVLAEFDAPAQAAAVVLEDIGFLSAGSDLADAAGVTRRSRVFAGYAGWGPGQLESELERDDWIVTPARREEIFSDDPARLWPAVLEGRGGQYALLARMPDDPSVN